MISMDTPWVGANAALHLQTAGFILRVLMFICAFSGSARFAADIRLILAWLGRFSRFELVDVAVKHR